MIARKSALIVISHIFGGILGYIALFFIAKYMSPAEYGIVSFALGFVALFSIIGNLGFHFSHIKRISEGKDIGKCNGTFIVIKVILTISMVLILISAFFTWKIVLNRGFESFTHEVAIFIMIIVWVIKLLGQIFSTTFRATKEIAKTEISLFLNTFMRVIVTIYVALGGYGAIALAITYVIGELTFFFSAFYFFRRYPVKKPSKEDILDYTRFAIPLIVVVVASTIIINIDKIFIQFFWEAENVGYYTASHRLSDFINIFAVSIGTLLLPTYSSYHAKNNLEGIKRLTYNSERYLSMIVTPMVFGLMILAEPIAKIFLSGWTPAIPVLQILPFYVLFLALENPYSSQFVGINRPKLARNRVLIMIVANIFLNLILVPYDIKSLGIKLVGLGETGAAIATVISFLIGLIYSRITVWKINRIKGCNKVFIHFFSGGIMSIVLYILLYHYSLVNQISRFVHILIFVLLGAIIYFGILFLLKEFRKDEYHFFMDTFNIKKMLSYIYHEIRRK